MIDIGFKFKEVRTTAPKSVYKLTVEYMHGDADGETQETHTYAESQVEDLKLDLLGIVTYLKLDGDFDEAEEDITAIYQSQGVEDPDDQASHWRDNFYEGDISCDGMPATLTGYELIYFDDAGRRHEVTLTFNGKAVE